MSGSFELWREWRGGDSKCLEVGGPAHSFPLLVYSGVPLFFFSFFSGGVWTPKNRQTPNKERPSFWHYENCPPPHRRNFTIDLQQCWSINRKIGNHQCTYYLVVRALTVADCCFFCSCHHSAAMEHSHISFVFVNHKHKFCDLWFATVRCGNAFFCAPRHKKRCT